MIENAGPEWPSYDVGPKECMFALGVVGVKYAKLEFALSAIAKIGDHGVMTESSTQAQPI